MAPSTLPLPPPQVPLMDSGGKPTQQGFEFLDRLQSLVKQLNATVAALSYAPTNAQYVTMAVDATLSAERTLTAGNGLTLTDGGANNPVTLAVAAGAALQILQNTNVTNTSLTTILPIDDTVPTITEGDEILSQAITLAATANKVAVLVCVPAASGSTVGVAVYRGSTCIWAGIFAPGAGEMASPVFLDAPGSTGPHTYSVRIGNNTGAVTRINGSTVGRIFGGVSAATLTLIEFKG